MKVIGQLKTTSKAIYAVVAADESKKDEFIKHHGGPVAFANYYQKRWENAVNKKELVNAKCKQSWHTSIYEGPSIVFEAWVKPLRIQASNNNQHLLYETSERIQFLMKPDHNLEFIQKIFDGNYEPVMGFVCAKFVMIRQGEFVGVRLFNSETDVVT